MKSGDIANSIENAQVSTSYSIKIPTLMSSKHRSRARSKSIIHVSSKYESLDYDIWENELLVGEESHKGYSHIIWINIIRWVLYLLVGLITGIVAIFIDISINGLTQRKYELLKYYMNKCMNTDCSLLSYTLWYLSVMVPVLIGTSIVIFIEPSAAGSGLPSVISHLNGVRIPRFTKLKVLIIKVLSVICACIAGLAAGKEGPFIHIGSIIGGLITSVKVHNLGFISEKMYHLNTDREKRDFMAAGCAAGVSAAFGSPVGATLMSLEEGTSFWSVNLMWKIFFCSIVSCFSFNTIFSWIIGYSGQHAYLGLFYFGKFNETTIEYEYFELPIFIGVGVIGGLLGAAFVAISMKIMLFRLRYVKSRYLQIMDTLLVSFLTATFAISSMLLLNRCQSESPSSYGKNTIQIFCKGGTYNELSVFWFHTQESILRLLFHSSPDSFGMETLLVFFLAYFILVMITLGINISAGIFIPSLLIGATWGRLIGLLLHRIFPYSPWASPGKYALLGAAAHLGGVVRITISLTVVIIEATGTLTFGFPLMVTLFTTKWVGDFFNEGIYESQINLLGIPILPNDPPPLTSDITAKDLMNNNVYVFPATVSIGNLLQILQKVTHHGFPVVKQIFADNQHNYGFKSYGQLRGFILRSQLVTLISNKSFNPPLCATDIKETLKMFRKSEESTVLLKNIELSEDEKNIKLDLKPYMNPSPYAISGVMSFPRVFRLFRSLGLRHVIVVNSKNEVIGIITRKDLAKFRLWRHATTMGLKELRIH